MMAFKGNKAAEKLDRLAIAGIGTNAQNGVAPRLSILANLLFLAAGIAGLVLCAQGDVGSGLVFAAMFAASTHTVIVEQRKRGNAPLDERERAIFWKATAIGAGVPCVLAACWVMLLGNFADQGMWQPDRPEEWRASGFFILGLMSQIANIASAWMTPSYAADLLDDE
jgi:hypothetical protein